MDDQQPQTLFVYLNLIVMVLTIYVMGAMVVNTIFILPPETRQLMDYIDNAVCLVFFIEFCIRFYHADNKWKFMQWGWIDLLACIPNVDFLRAGRLIRLVRLIRIFKAFKTTKNLTNYYFKNKANGSLATASLLAVLLIIFSSIAILQVETEPNSNIKTAEDAIWWSYVTITTVGYGDKYPVTTEGRIIAAVLMAAGIGLVGTFTAFIASWFVAENKVVKEG